MIYMKKKKYLEKLYLLYKRVFWFFFIKVTLKLALLPIILLSHDFCGSGTWEENPWALGSASVMCLFRGQLELE